MTEPNNTDSTPERRETSLQKSASGEMLTYAKWGLMGVGAIALINIVTGLVFSPFGLLLLAGGGGVAWWQLKGKKTFGRSGDSAVPPPPSTQPFSPPAPPAPMPPPAGLPPVPARGSAAPLAPPGGPSPKVPGFAADELAEFDRRLSELDSID